MRGKVKDSLGGTKFILAQSVKSFFANRSLAASASLAYYSLFALLPLLLLLFYLMSFFITSSEAVMARITTLMGQFIPHYSEVILKEVGTLSARPGLLGAVGTLTLIWAATPLMSALREAFFRAYKLEKKPSFLKGKLADMGIILVTLFMLVVLGLSGAAVGVASGGWSLSGLFMNVLSFSLTVAIMSAFYTVLSPSKVSYKYVLAGAFVTAILWGIIKPLFGLFLSYNPRYGITFGSLKALFIIIMWLYYSFAVLLFGVEVIANLRRKDVLLLKGLFHAGAGRANGPDARLMKKFGRMYEAGEILFAEGDAGNEMFYVVSGSIALDKGGQVLKVMQEGDYFGEMALLIETPRTTSAHAGEDGASVIAITPENFETLLREEPKIAMLFLRELAKRLKETNESVASGSCETAK